ncbi:MAG: AAA domain-containing protein, partial [Chloroflexota bacterium]|nr:AAA domain-containing protein [Chloroflexota bacterium]
QRPGDPIVPADSGSARDAAAALALALDETTLAVQGPPGSGKTSTAAGMIVELLKAGRRVGITANSHKVIGNLLERVCEVASRENVDLRPIQRAGKDEVSSAASVVRAPDNAAVRDALAAGDANLAAGTSWLWARAELMASVDVLFVDEAGQFALANALAIAGAASSVVLLGDPLQLDQPLQGTHPPGAEKSCLAHVLGDDATMPPERGLFLERTHRLHPALCRYTSEAFYDARLEPEPGLERQELVGTPRGELDGAGIRFVPVRHEGNQNESAEEAETVAAIVRGLVEGGARWVDRDGNSARVAYDDVLVVAPYNAHVAAIRRLLPAEARVGTVDKFQGQQAPVAIYAMATSTPEDAPRGMDFLYSRHRLNVATSRARCVAVLVCAPDLLRVRARTPSQMRLANAFAQLVEQARPLAVVA